MELIVNRERCIGAGMCALMAPALFDQAADDGLVILRAEARTPQQQADAREAVAACPSGAIRSAEEPARASDCAGDGEAV
ncbi:ferredoxin [Nocardia sp. NPDC046473]|uniref:ferredoxin n=1 Tax=Nocardia sp. NPDC046473 TaxID=3155733 RepID=UPI0033F8BC40